MLMNSMEAGQSLLEIVVEPCTDFEEHVLNLGFLRKRTCACIITGTGDGARAAGYSLRDACPGIPIATFAGA